MALVDSGLTTIVQLHVRQRITHDVIPGCSGGHVKCMAVIGKIAICSFKIPANRAL